VLSREPDNEVLLEYLLGGLPEPELSRIQVLCFVDDSMYERLSALESGLIDRYVQRTLPEAERVSFDLPASVFKKKDYVLVVDGMKPDGAYSNLDARPFSVVNENVRCD
jgi:hypothetical protein